MGNFIGTICKGAKDYMDDDFNPEMVDIITKMNKYDGSSTHFGLKGSSTYLDNKDDAKRSAYLKRHKANEQWNNPKTAGSLSKHILWGETTSLQANIKSFKKKFNL